MSLSPAPSPKGFRRYQKQWETHARFDALWAVLTLKEKIGGEWDEEHFFQIGREEIKEVFRYLHVNQLKPNQNGKCLDFGSGVGRLSLALSDYFDEVVGIDISPTMVAKATQYAKSKKVRNAKFVLSESAALSQQLGAGDFDFIYSNITLQHIERNLQESYLQEFSKLLKPGGIAVLQIPSRKPAPARWSSALKVALSLEWRRMGTVMAMAVRKGVMPWNAQMELNIFPKGEFEAKANEYGFEVGAVAYIDWFSFYESTRFALSEESQDELAFYPESPVYFLRKS